MGRGRSWTGVGELGAQPSLGRAGTLARAGSRCAYMSIPRRNTASCSRSSWSCSSTGVWFMGEKPRAGMPAYRGEAECQEGQPAAAATQEPHPEGLTARMWRLSVNPGRISGSKVRFLGFQGISWKRGQKVGKGRPGGVKGSGRRRGGVGSWSTGSHVLAGSTESRPPGV